MPTNKKDDSWIAATAKDIAEGRIPLAVRNLKPGQSILGGCGLSRISRIDKGIVAEKAAVITRKIKLSGIPGIMEQSETKGVQAFFPVPDSEFLTITTVTD